MFEHIKQVNNTPKKFSDNEIRAGVTLVYVIDDMSCFIVQYFKNKMFCRSLIVCVYNYILNIVFYFERYWEISCD